MKFQDVKKIPRYFVQFIFECSIWVAHKSLYVFGQKGYNSMAIKGTVQHEYKKGFYLSIENKTKRGWPKKGTPLQVLGQKRTFTGCLYLHAIRNYCVPFFGHPLLVLFSIDRQTDQDQYSLSHSFSILSNWADFCSVRFLSSFFFF